MIENEQIIQKNMYAWFLLRTVINHGMFFKGIPNKLQQIFCFLWEMCAFKTLSKTLQHLFAISTFSLFVIFEVCNIWQLNSGFWHLRKLSIKF